MNERIPDPGNVASILTMREAERRAKKAGKTLHIEHEGLWWPVLEIIVQGPVVAVRIVPGVKLVRPRIGANFDIR